MKLPFLYAHGPLVWKGVAVLLVLASCWLVSRCREAVACWRIRSVVRWAEARVRPLEHGWGVLRGRIVTGFAETIDSPARHQLQRSEKLVIEIDGELVAIDGN